MHPLVSATNASANALLQASPALSSSDVAALHKTIEKLAALVDSAQQDDESDKEKRFPGSLARQARPFPQTRSPGVHPAHRVRRPVVLPASPPPLTMRDLEKALFAPDSMIVEPRDIGTDSGEGEEDYGEIGDLLDRYVTERWTDASLVEDFIKHYDYIVEQEIRRRYSTARQVTRRSAAPPIPLFGLYDLVGAAFFLHPRLSIDTMFAPELRHIHAYIHKFVSTDDALRTRLNRRKQDDVELVEQARRRLHYRQRFVLYISLVGTIVSHRELEHPARRTYEIQDETGIIQATIFADGCERQKTRWFGVKEPLPHRPRYCSSGRRGLRRVSTRQPYSQPPRNVKPPWPRLLPIPSMRTALTSTPTSSREYFDVHLSSDDAPKPAPAPLQSYPERSVLPSTKRVDSQEPLLQHVQLNNVQDGQDDDELTPSDLAAYFALARRDKHAHESIAHTGTDVATRAPSH
ncbi:hypothetical protein MKEN_00391000 [Mycena kentingensis (nom. inval.)]|nr:hypothetical protein MKEN_00391000 [Mycena kentingensis (nom. inval.)]